MNLIVVGCGRLGSELAYRLFKKGHKVAVVDVKDESFINLPADFSGRTIEGEALDRDVLRRAGIEKANGFAAVTSSDTTNTVIAHIAKTHYNIPNVVVRNYDPRWRSLYEAFNLQVVGSSSWGAQRIEELLYYNEMRTVFSAGNGEVEVYEFSVPESWAGRRLAELLPDHGCAPSALTRAGHAILPQLDTVLHPGDVLLVSATFDGIEALRRRTRDGQEI